MPENLPPRLGEENKSGLGWTHLWFTDGFQLRVIWDGRHSVAGLADSGPIIVYCPYGRRLHIPWHIVEMIEHQEASDQ